MNTPGWRLHSLKGDRQGLSLMAMYNPPHPGEFIKEVYLEPLSVSPRSVAFENNNYRILYRQVGHKEVRKLFFF